MLSPSIDRRTLLSQLRTALLLGAGFGIGLWLWVTQGARFAGVVLAVTILSGIVWQYRVYAARRWHALMDAYAEREMAQRQRR